MSGLKISLPTLGKAIFGCVTLALIFFVGTTSFSEEGTKDQTLSQKPSKLVRQTVNKNVEYYYLHSLVPSHAYVPPLYKHQRYHESYSSFLRDHYPKLSKGLIKPDHVDLYNIKKYDHKPIVHYGMPPYLSLNELKQGAVKPETPSINITDILRANNLEEHFDLSDDLASADIYILPIIPHSYLRILNPDVVKSPQLDRHKYSDLFDDFKDTFFNLDVFESNDEGLPGAYIKDKNGNIVSSYCPVDITKNEEAIEKDIFYCLVQASGLPSFRKSFPENNQTARSWAKVLLTFNSCEAIKAGQDYFSLSFSNPFFEKCLTEGDYQNVSKSY